MLYFDIYVCVHEALVIDWQRDMFEILIKKEEKYTTRIKKTTFFTTACGLESLFNAHTI